jgi:hypothetical protein
MNQMLLDVGWKLLYSRILNSDRGSGPRSDWQVMLAYDLGGVGEWRDSSDWQPSAPHHTFAYQRGWLEGSRFLLHVWRGGHSSEFISMNNNWTYLYL